MDVCSSFSLRSSRLFAGVPYIRGTLCIDPRVYTRQKEEITRSAAIDDATAIEERKPKKRLMVNYDLTTDIRGSGRASFNRPVLYNTRIYE